MRWSFSQIMTFETCAFKYLLQYYSREAARILGLTVVPQRGPKSQAVLRGDASHKNIEAHLKEKHPLSPDLMRWSGAFSEIRQYPVFPEHKIALDRQWKPVPYDSVEAWVRCILDLKVLKPNLVSVYDWKTGKEWPEHWDQKTLYGIAALAEHPEYYEVNAVHVYLDSGKQVPRTYHRDQLHAFRTQWYDRASKLERALDDLTYAKNAGDLKTSFPPQPNRFCSYCDFSRAKGGPCQF